VRLSQSWQATHNLRLNTMPLQATSGAASYDAFGGGVPVVPNYIEEVFSTWLYTGTGTSITVNNGIDFAGKGGLLWAKDRSFSGENNRLYDTARGYNKVLFSNATNSSGTVGDLTSFNSNGFTVASDATSNINYAPDNPSPHNYVTWSFRKQPKFFDVVTYTGNGGTQQNIPHNLQASPNLIIVKRTDAAGDWYVAPMMLSNWNNDYLVLNSTAAKVASSDIWQGTSGKSSTTFGVRDGSTVNISGATYVAYLFAHNAGGFGLTGTDNVISCGSFTTNGSANATVNLGYEPQWVMAKRSSGTGGWCIQDNMRGFTASPTSYPANPILFANNNDAEITGGANTLQMTATGFTTDNVSYNANSTYIYIAIRRGPMKVPTSGTSVFAPITNSASTGTVNTTGFPVDMGIVRWRDGTDSNFLRSRLQGVSTTTTESGAWLKTNTTDAESTSGGLTRLWDNTGFQTTSGFSGYSTVYWNFGRAPSFFDEVCYTGTSDSVGKTVNHNLGVVPELMIVKSRSTTNSWVVYAASLGNTSGLLLNGTNAVLTGRSDFWDSTTPTSSVFSIGSTLNANTVTWVAYLFSTCAGVSKCFNYTGNGSSQTINCGFTSGARFVLIKRTNAAGDWYVWDSARGIVSGNDPHLSLNTTAAEVTTDDTIDTDSTGFVVNQVSATNVNVSSATYIGLAIA